MIIISNMPITKINEILHPQPTSPNHPNAHTRDPITLRNPPYPHTTLQPTKTPITRIRALANACVLHLYQKNSRMYAINVSLKRSAWSANQTAPPLFQEEMI